MAYNLNGVRWNPNDTVVTWSIATTNFGGQPGGPFDTAIGSQAVINTIATAISWWDAASGLSFQMVPDAANVDIRFGYGPVAGSATGLTSYSFDANSYFIPGITIRLEYSDANPAPLPLIAHEIGHALGLGHYEAETAIMNSIVNGGLTGLQASDLEGIQFLYGTGGGPPPPTDDFAGNSGTTGQVSVGNSVTGNLEAIGDRDWFRVQLNAGTTYTIDLLGLDTGAGTLDDPYLRVFNNASVLVAEDDDDGAGRNSNLTYTPGQSGTYYIAAGAFSDNDTGTYRVTISGPSGPPVASLGDVLWRHTDGTVATAGHNLGAVPNTWSISGIGDFNGDGDSDIMWRHVDGLVVAWEMQNGQYLQNNNIAFASTGWEIVNTGDFDADGDSDVLWRHRDGAVVTWEMENGNYVQNHNIAFASIGWTIQGLGDFDADGDSDIIWRHRDGAVVTWEMENNGYVVNHNIAFASVGWTIQGTGDFDGDGDDDILWRHNEGAVVTWEMENGAYITNHNIASASPTFQIRGIRDFDSDGDSDILWRGGDGLVVTWEMEGGEFLQTNNFGVIANAWQIRGTGEFDLA
jgi:Matrixin/Bacterial pre-peptidase C-terminal domain/FG-GAP-like repeat